MGSGKQLKAADQVVSCTMFGSVEGSQDHVGSGHTLLLISMRAWAHLLIMAFFQACNMWYHIKPVVSNPDFPLDQQHAC